MSSCGGEKEEEEEEVGEEKEKRGKAIRRMKQRWKEGKKEEE